jgi:nucleoside-diphosphate-sugar epimerase
VQEPLNIVLLGANGFTGSAVLRYAAALNAKSLPVRALVRDPLRLSAHGATVFTGDILDLPTGLFPDHPHVVIHLATKQIDGDGTGFHMNNVEGTKRVMDRLNPHCRGVLYGSSVSVYGQGAQVDVDESCPVQPETELAASRAAAERIVLGAAAARGIGAYCLRPRFVFGRGDRHTIPGLVRMIRRGVKPGSGAQCYTIFDVDDYARVLVELALRVAETSERLAVNAGYAASVSLNTIVEVLCGRFGLEPPRRCVPVSLRTTRLLRRLPVAAVRTLATRLELFGLPHTFRVDRLRALLETNVTSRDPRGVLEAAAAAQAGAL